MAGKAKRKAAAQPVSSAPVSKRPKATFKSPPAAQALQSPNKSKAAGPVLHRSLRRSANTNESDNHIRIAVAKAVDESKQLKECRGEARKDLYSSIVDLLTEALVKDVDSVNLRGTTAHVSLSARDEPIPAHEQLPAKSNTHAAQSMERSKSTGALGRQTPRHIDAGGKQSDAEQKSSPLKRVALQTEQRAREKDSIGDTGKPPKSPKNDLNANATITPNPPLLHAKRSPHAAKSKTKPGLLKKAAAKSSASTTILPSPKKDATPKEPTEFIEESIVDEGAAAMPDPESQGSSGKKRKRTKRSSNGSAYHTEEVLDSSDHDINSDQRSKDLILNARSRMPWWRATESLVSLPSKPGNPEDLLKLYVMAVIRSCVRDSWNAENLKRCFDKDPSSSRGKAFLAISSSLLLMERARHMGQCHVKWRPELIQELVQRRVIEWSKVPKHISFDHFAGCDVCLGQREGNIRLWLRGDRYDSSDFWPGSSRIDVLSSEERLDQDIMSVAVELVNGTKNERFVRIGEHRDTVDAEFWVDPQCLRKCLLFHELVHATAIIAQDLRILIEDELRDGVVHLDMRNRLPGDDKLGVSERLERYLVQAVTESRDFLKRRTKHLMEIIRLGDIYFSSVEEEVIDSGNFEGRRARKTPQMYDPPIALNDEKYKDRIERIVSLTQQREINASFATFG